MSEYSSEVFESSLPIDGKRYSIHQHVMESSGHTATSITCFLHGGWLAIWADYFKAQNKCEVKMEWQQATFAPHKGNRAMTADVCMFFFTIESEGNK
jgi:hypothetical protein